MKKYKMLEEINKIDDEMLSKTLSIDTSLKLKEEIKREKIRNRKNVFKYFSLLATCSCLFIIGVFMFINKKDNNEIVQIPSPITEVTSISDMKLYLGYDVPLLKNKNVKSYLVIDEGDNKKLGRIIYDDESVFSISEVDDNVSGIYGATFEKESTINDILVKYYTMENIKYASWQYRNKYYAFSTNHNNDLEKNVKELITQIRK